MKKEILQKNIALFTEGLKKNSSSNNNSQILTNTNK